MSSLLANQIEAIRIIDKKIDGIRLELYRRVGRFNTLEAAAWDLAWRRCPDLYARQEALFRFRGVAQQIRDAIIDTEYRAEQRRERAAHRKAMRAAA